MHFIETPSGLNWHYDVKGEGPAILFIHGWGVNMRIWRQQIKHFSQRFKVISIDLPGHGKTNWVNVTTEDMAKDLHLVLDHLKVDRLGFVGSSLGGLVALKAYDIYPERFYYMVFVGSQPKFARSADYPYGLDVSRIRQLAWQLDNRYPNMLHIFFRSLFTKEERATRRFKWIQTFRAADYVPDKKALLEMLNVLEKEDLRATLDKIDIPVQFINGTEDNICSRDFFVYLQSKMPEAKFSWFHQCGHFPFLSKPHEFNEALDGFLKEVHGQ